jgi:hypothetical protein
LETLAADIQRTLPASLADRVAPELLALKERYTMDREREIHQSLLVQGSPEFPEKRLEARSIEPEGEEPKRIPAGGEEDLGDNVELF